MVEESNRLGSKFVEIAFTVFQSLSTESFFRLGFLTIDICKELMQVFTHAVQVELSWADLGIPVLSQIVRVCPEEYFQTEGFASLALELCVTNLYRLYQSDNAISHDPQRHGDLISTLFMTMKSIFDRCNPQMQITALLVLVLTSYNCIGGASTELCILKAISFVQSIETSLKRYIDEKAKGEDDSLGHLRTVFGAMQNMITTLMQDCLRDIHLLENKRAEVFKLFKMKLLFCLEHSFSVAKLFHENQHLQENKDNNQFLYQVYTCCSKCIKLALSDFDIQVQTVGLHVLKSLVQIELGEAAHAKSQSFIMFFMGELFGDIFQLVQKMIEKPVTKEAVTVAGESLRLLVLLQTLSKDVECQKGLMNLLLEIIVMVFSQPTVDLSPELNEIRSTALRLVSHLAQIPSSAIHFKDVLLAMPVTRREKLQDIIRASVAEDNSTQMKPTSSPLIIKIPVPKEQSKKDDSQVTASTSATNISDENSFDEEEDWDAFQSFPASADASSKVEGTAAEDNSVDKSYVTECNFETSDDIQEHSSPQPVKDINEVHEVKHLEGTGDNIVMSSDERDDWKMSSESSMQYMQQRSMGSGGSEDNQSSLDLPMISDEPCVEAPSTDNQAQSTAKQMESRNASGVFSEGDRDNIVMSEDEQDDWKMSSESSMQYMQQRSMGSGGSEDDQSSSDPPVTTDDPCVEAPSTDNQAQSTVKQVDSSSGVSPEARSLDGDADIEKQSEHGQATSEPQHTDEVLETYDEHSDVSESHSIEGVGMVTTNNVQGSSEHTEDLIIKEETDPPHEDNIVGRGAEKSQSGGDHQESDTKSDRD